MSSSGLQDSGFKSELVLGCFKIRLSVEGSFLQGPGPALEKDMALTTEGTRVRPPLEVAELHHPKPETLNPTP